MATSISWRQPPPIDRPVVEKTADQTAFKREITSLLEKGIISQQNHDDILTLFQAVVLEVQDNLRLAIGQIVD